MIRSFHIGYLARCCVVVIVSALACVPAVSSNFAHLVTEVREQHTESIHPEFVTVRDKGGRLFVSGQVGRDPGTPTATHGTVTVEVRDKDGRLVRETKGCFEPEAELNYRHTILSSKPPRFDVDLGEGFEEPIMLVVRVEPGLCKN